jgi:hypothetical protein
MWQRGHSRLVYLSQPILAIIGHRSLAKVDGILQGILVMRSARTIATLASVAALVCSILALCWVGLALLGF